MSGDAIGMMEGAYFVSRSSLLAWLNGLLQTDYDKVESVSTGVPHLQILDALFPGEVPLHKANLHANPALDYECLPNWKLVQDVFNRKNLGRVLPVQKLVRGRYQDNLEILQWMKSYFERHWKDGQTYDAAARREEAQRQYSAARQKRRGGPLKPLDGNASPAAKSTPVKTPRKPLDKQDTPRAGGRRPAAAGTPKKLFTPKVQVQAPESAKSASPVVVEDGVPLLSGPPASPGGSPAASEPSAKRAKSGADALEAAVARLEGELRQAQLAAHVKDRQAVFYCSKLRDIALAVKSYQKSEEADAVIQKIQALLATELSVLPPPTDSPA
eukprot:EG_transcript_19400